MRASNVDISIHRPLAGPDVRKVRCRNMPHISIHRPLAGPDVLFFLFLPVYVYFNPQAPCGARRVDSHNQKRTDVFQSTGPLRGPTRLPHIWTNIRLFQSTGPLRGPTTERLLEHEINFISIHRPLAGPDRMTDVNTRRQLSFQSTGPLRGPTASAQFFDASVDISIHRPLAGPDVSALCV